MSESKTPAGPELHCDLIMKGGITSGVVFPLAISELSGKYRFKNIGGTSAGAIAAGFAAAAEYRRQHDVASPNSGFDKIDKLPAEIAPLLFGFFQPTAALKPLYSAVSVFLEGKKSKLAMLGKVTKSYFIYQSWLMRIVHGLVLAGLVACLLSKTALWLEWVPEVAVAFVQLVSSQASNLAWAAILLFIFSLVRIVWKVYCDIFRNLPKQGFGICSGMPGPGYTQKSLTPWLSDKLNEIAGKAPGDGPLTFGDLSDAGLTFQVMTTNLSQRRAHQVPMLKEDGDDLREFSFNEDEFRGLFPTEIVDHMVEVGESFERADEQGVKRVFYKFPRAKNLPVVVAMRMSLSFPVLISAIPLYNRDFTFKEDKAQQIVRKCWFSDGGLSSNMPIHFFDSLLPNSPTFAISLDEYDEGRDGAERTSLSNANIAQLLPIHSIGGLPEFLMSIVGSAKDWQDNLQCLLPGYRERIVKVSLTKEEGGLNLNMPEETIHKLTKYGKEAGEKLSTHFNFENHQWSRFLVAMTELEDLMVEIDRSWAASENGQEEGAGTGFEAFLNRYNSDAPPYPRKGSKRADLDAKAAALAAFAKSWQNPSIKGDSPVINGKLRITPDA